MAKNNNRYIQFYTPGSAAVKVEVQEEANWAPLPKVKKIKKTAIYVDPVSVISFAVAICMLIAMAVGISQLNTARREVVALEHYVAQLTAENKALEESYHASYRPDLIRRQAMDLGMVPVEEIPVTPIQVEMPVQAAVEETSLWEQITTYLTDLFA